MRRPSCGEKDNPIEPKGKATVKKGIGGEAVSSSERAIEPVDLSLIKPCFSQGELFNMPVVFVLKKFVNLFETGLAGVSVSFEWKDINEDPFSYKLLDVSHIPQPIYVDLVKWVTLLMEDEELCQFVYWSFTYILEPPSGVKRFQNVSIFLALAMVLRTKPHLLVMKPDNLTRHQFDFNCRDIFTTPLTVWMVHQVSRTSFSLGLQSWFLYLLPQFFFHNPRSTNNAQTSRTLILQLAKKIMKHPDAHTTISDPFFRGYRLIPPPSLELLLRFRFLSLHARNEDKAERFYTWFKNVALKGAPQTDAIMQQIFTVSFGLVGNNNRCLAEEAAEIAIWSLTENDACWVHWNSLCLSEVNLKDCVFLLKKLVEKWNYQSREPPSPSRKAMTDQCIQQMFNVSFILGGKGRTAPSTKAVLIAIGCLAENDACWVDWNSLCLSEENLEASLILLNHLVANWDYFSREPSSSRKAMTHQCIQQIFNVSFRLAGKGCYASPKEAAEIAIWSLTENIDCWKCWDHLYQENVEASVALLQQFEVKWNEYSIKLSSPSDTLTLTQTIKSFRLKNKINKDLLYKEADKSCKVISRRLSRGITSLKCTCITALVLVTTVAAASLVLPESVFGFFK